MDRPEPPALEPSDDATGVTTAIVDALPLLALDAIRDYAIIALDDDGGILSWSSGAHLLTGYAEAEVRGRPYTVFDPHEDETGLLRMLATARATGRFHQERWWRHRDGSLIRVDESINPIDSGGFVVVARDLSASEEAASAVPERSAPVRGEAPSREHERELRAELQAAERRAAFLAEASSILVATSLDLDSTLRALVRLAVSRLADWCVIHEMDGDGRLRRAAVAHRDPRLQDELAERVDRAFEAGWEQAVRGVIGTGQSQLLDRAAAARWFAREDGATGLTNRIGFGSVMLAPLTGRGSVLGVVTLVKGADGADYDEEDLELAEELAARAAIAMDNAALYLEAQEANRAKADFLAVMSHELRTPLNAIMGYSDLLNAEITGRLTDRQHRQVDRVRASARHLLQLIEEILGFARMEAGGEEVRIESVAVDRIIADAAASARPVADAKDLDFRVDVEDADVVMETDPDKLRQLLVNLLSNAVKFTEHGSVTLRFRRDSDHGVFEIIDTGVGIPADRIHRIFDPFWQLERPNTRRFGGTGLGLSLSRRYARLLRGEITVESEPGRGSLFRVTLPLRVSSAEPPAA
jgi:PAS domain S-box-containing protein